MDWLAVVIEEYKTLREESLTSLQTQQSILRFGTATLGIVLVAGFNVWERPLLSEIIFFFFAPLISYLVLIIWMGEIARMMRSGVYLLELEKKVSKEFSDKPEALTWENWLRQGQQDGKTPQLIWNYKAIIAMFLLLALASIAVGNYKAYVDFCLTYIVIINMLEVIFFLIVTFFVYKQGKLFR